MTETPSRLMTTADLPESMQLPAIRAEVASKKSAAAAGDARPA